jgi:hypothetical protein
MKRAMGIDGRLESSETKSGLETDEAKASETKSKLRKYGVRL